MWMSLASELESQFFVYLWRKCVKRDESLCNPSGVVASLWKVVGAVLAFAALILSTVGSLPVRSSSAEHECAEYDPFSLEPSTAEPTGPPEFSRARFCPEDEFVVDAVRGIVLSWVDYPNRWAEIRVQGLPPGSGPYQLYDDEGFWAFQNGTADDTGELVMPRQNLTPGLWQLWRGLERNQTLATEFVVGFGAPVALAATYSSTSTRAEAPGRQPPPCGWTTRRHAFVDRLVPLSVLHSPFQGNSRHDESYTDTRTFAAGENGIASSTSNRFILTSSAGQTGAVFQLARFGAYKTWNPCGGGPYYSYAIEKWHPGLSGADLSGPLRYTDGDDLTEIPGSVYFDHRYGGADTYVDPRGYPRGELMSLGVGRSDLSTWGAGVRFSLAFVPFELRAQATNGRSFYHEYTFPGGTDVQFIDYVREDGQTWAFCTPSLASCG